MDWQRGTIPYYNMPEGYIPEEEMKKLKEESKDDDFSAKSVLDNLNQ